MIKSGKGKRFVWVLSLSLGAVAYCTLFLIIFLTPPGVSNIAAVKDDLAGLLETLASFWVAGFVFVWVLYWLSKFVVKYGPFV